MSPGVVATIHLAGVRGEPCGALRWTVQRSAPQGCRSTFKYFYVF